MVGKVEIGIVIAAYQSADTIDRAIKSVIGQTAPCWQLVVVDDGSSDETFAAASTYSRSDARIQVIRQKNSGAALARHAGIQKLKTEYVCYLDADDELAPDYLEFMLRFTSSNPGYVIYGVNILCVTDDERSMLWSNESQRVVSLVEMEQEYSMALSGAWVAKDEYDNVGGFAAYNTYCEDFYLLMRLLIVGEAIVSGQPLYYYHINVHDQKSTKRLRIFISVIRTLYHLKWHHVSNERQKQILARMILMNFERMWDRYINETLRHLLHRFTRTVTGNNLYQYGLRQLKGIIKRG
ncbi:MAG: glycosyltransferase family 2 protein [Coriobacteriia bacterium]|nr:glycosyltransferase family 2 protein [Coriobacteriia bacterium]